MFRSARVQLTAWYVLILMLISGLFSVAFYQASTREIQRIINVLQFEQTLEKNTSWRFIARPRNVPSIEELQQVKQRYRIMLVMVNAGILFVAGVASYFLAGQTLSPIKSMVEEQQEFIANASHELRTPISTLRAELESYLFDSTLDHKTKAIITSNLEEVAILQQLTDRLLRTTQDQMPRDTHDQKQSTVPQLFATMKKNLASLAKKKKITLDFGPAVNRTVPHTQEVQEILMILVENAMKYSPEESVVHIHAAVKKHATVFTVIDHGIGIERHHLPHIFERFYRADTSRSRTSGYGLGLAIAKKIVEALDGEIRVDSAVGKGSTFTLTIPC